MKERIVINYFFLFFGFILTRVLNDFDFDDVKHCHLRLPQVWLIQFARKHRFVFFKITIKCAPVPKCAVVSIWTFVHCFFDCVNLGRRQCNIAHTYVQLRPNAFTVIANSILHLCLHVGQLDPVFLFNLLRLIAKGLIQYFVCILLHLLLVLKEQMGELIAKVGDS